MDGTLSDGASVLQVQGTEMIPGNLKFLTQTNP